MFNKILLSTLLLGASFFNENYAANYAYEAQNYIQCDPELQGCLQLIQELPEARELIATIQQEGPITIVVNNNPYLTKKFGAFWNPQQRIITVNYSSSISQGSLIGSIIFEMHNALVTSQMNQLDALAASGKIDRNTYVEEFERLEYKNSKDASRLVRKGIQKKIFPKSAHLPTYSTFEEHFFVQKQSGHSAFIAKNFDQIARKKIRWTSSSAKRAW